MQNDRGEEGSVDLSSFPLLRIDQISRHKTETLVDSEARLSALGHDEDDGIESSIAAFVSKLLAHVRKEIADRREKEGGIIVRDELSRPSCGDGSSDRCAMSNDARSTKPPRADLPEHGWDCALLSTNYEVTSERSTRNVANSSTYSRSHSLPLTRPPSHQRPHDRTRTSSLQPSFFVSSSPKSKLSSFRSRAKQAKASLWARSSEAISRQSERERHERTRRALETMQDWHKEREKSRKRREDLLETERGLRLERQRARMEREVQVRSSMHAAAEEARANALAAGCTDEEAIVEAAAAAAKVVDDDSTVFQPTAENSDDGSFINDDYENEECSPSQLSSDEMAQVDNSFVIANDPSKQTPGPHILSECIEESVALPSESAATTDPTPGPQICFECTVESVDLPSATGKLQSGKPDERTDTDISHPPVIEKIDRETPPNVPPMPETLQRAHNVYDDDDNSVSADLEVTDDIETQEPPDEAQHSHLTTADDRTSRVGAKPIRIKAARETKYCDTFPSFSGIFVDPPGGRMQTSDADVRQSELSKSLKNQIVQYTRMSTAFAALSLEQTNDSSDCSDSLDQGLFYHINSRRPEVASIIRSAFTNSSWSELPRDVEGNYWNLMWVWGLPKASTFENLLVFQKINRFRDTRGLTRKDLLKKNMDSFDFMPLTYALPHEFNSFVSGYQSLQKANGNRGDNYWIMKPVGLSRGRGISIVNDIAAVSYSRPIVIQRYIQDPLCFMGFKFDLRMYVLVTSFSPLEAFIYKDGLARFGSRQYLLKPESLNDKRIHLTNSSVQKDYVDEVDRSHPAYLAGSRGYGNKVAFTWLWKRLEEIGMDTDELWLKLVNVCRTALITTGSDIQHQPNSFEIFGYDLMFDRSLKCWLIEVNSSPSLACDSPLDDHIKGNLIKDTIALVDPPAYDRKALANVCKRRLTHRKSSSNVSDRAVLETDLAEILMNGVPRKFGEIPKRLGNFERIVPMVD
ncbi:hypothetical protein ACHAW5_003478 [Stephanodiscus triporus]|uniref:Tubulin--tyrosine ligase-like protein 9 n=1 Tax=Stephanodiscus triporus TaxID=2934178 RepID=A0ABD3MLG1_9STRA